MNYDPRTISNRIIRKLTCIESGDKVSHLKLQKLLFYSQAWSLAVLGKSLFKEDFQAWTHGPVLPSIYHENKGNFYLTETDIQEQEVASDIQEVLDDVLEIYGERSGKYLEELTHCEE